MHRRGSISGESFLFIYVKHYHQLKINGMNTRSARYTIEIRYLSSTKHRPFNYCFKGLLWKLLVLVNVFQLNLPICYAVIVFKIYEHCYNNQYSISNPQIWLFSKLYIGNANLLLLFYILSVPFIWCKIYINYNVAFKLRIGTF